MNTVVGQLARTLQNRRRDVNGRTDRRACALRLRIGGIKPDKGAANNALVMNGALQHQLVVAHEVAMVAHEHDDGVFSLAGLFQMVQNAPDLGINMGNGTIVQGNRFAGLALGAGKQRWSVLDGFAFIAQLMQQLQVSRQGMWPKMEGGGWLTSSGLYMSQY